MAKVVRIFDAAGALRAEVWRGLLARVDSIDCKTTETGTDMSGLVGLKLTADQGEAGTCY